MVKKSRIPGLGTFLKINDPAVVEIVALSGFDFVIIDMEHGAFSFESVYHMVRAAQARNIKAIIRVGELNPLYIQRALDTGCDGIQIPQVNTPEDAENAVGYAKFHPSGKRGMCRFVRAAQYSATPKSAYFQEANSKLIIIHIEGIEGIRNLKEILAVPQIDVFFLGPYDLSQSCGVPGKIKDKAVIEKMLYAIQTAQKHNKYIGTFTDTIEDLRFWREKGVHYIAHSVDTGVLYETYSSIRKNDMKGL